jgi:F-type H+-transporting ATPase subunit b
MISVDGSLVIQIVNFIFLIWVLNVVLYKPIRNVLIQRKETVSGLEAGIEQSSKTAREASDAFGSGIRDARVKGQQEKEALLQAGIQEEKTLIAKINQKAQADLADVRVQISRQAEGVRATLLGEIDDFANAICQKILGRTI